MIKTVSLIEDVRALVKQWRAEGQTVALVPTMGALHAGHMRLVDRAKETHDRVIVSIFVNPTQFAPHEDLDRYPRTLEADTALLERHKGDAIFCPDVLQMYPDGFATSINLDVITQELEGQFRPTHFAGVALVVAKLLLQVLPDTAFFGEKDYQQLLVIKRMVCDLDIPVAIKGVEIVREADGLALSSRNIYLDSNQRETALLLSTTLKQSIAQIKSGAPIPDVLAQGCDVITQAGFQLDYLDVRDAETLMPVHNLDRSARILVAAKIGQTRLIDNMAVL